MQPRARILVVDDSEEIREWYELVLQPAGYEVATAADGAEGLEKLRTWQPDLVLLDVVMPVMDGLELLLKLRSDVAPPVPPVILCSGFDLTEEEAVRRGAALFLSKPVDNADLLAAIEEVLQQRAIQPKQRETQRSHAFAARERVLAAAREFVSHLELHGLPSLPALERLAQTQLATLADFLGVSRGVIALVRDRGLTVSAVVGAGTLQRGDDLGPALPEAYQVLETGSSLLLPDASAYPFFSVSRALDGARFFAGVPLHAEGHLPVGVVCLFGPAARAIDADDLGALQSFGRRGSDVLVRYAQGASVDMPPLRYGPGCFSRPMFEQLLDAEMRILDRRGGSMELLLVDVPDTAVVAQALSRLSGSRQRLLATALTPTRAAVFKRSLDDDARTQLGHLVEELRALGISTSLGIVDLVGGGVRWLGANGLLNAATIALHRAQHGRGDVRRIVIEEHAT